MALGTPSSAAEIDQRSKIDVQREVTASNPFLRNSWLGALITAFANRVMDFYYYFQQRELEALPDTATIDGNLVRWASAYRVTRLAAVQSEGPIVVTGTAPGIGALIASGSSFATTDDKEYTTTVDANLAQSTISVASITRVGTLATLTTDDDHVLASHVLITVAGASPAAYNVSATAITVTGATTLEYTMASDPGASASGTITLTHISIPINMASVETGDDYDQDADTAMTMQTPVAYIDSEQRVGWDGVGGGADQESEPALRARLLDRIQNPIAHFNANELISLAKGVAGVTRVWVDECTPETGQVTVYFMRDDDAVAIPSETERLAVDAAIQAFRPATSLEADVIIDVPTPDSEAFTFTALSPETAGMKTAVEASLAEFFSESTNVGENVPEDAYRAAIYHTVDPVTGDELESFTLSTPTTALTIAAGNIATLGNITWNL